MEGVQPIHRVEIGNSIANRDFPKNTQTTSFFHYIVLLVNVIWVEINTFYSFYFLVLGTLQALPADLSSTNYLTTYIPLVFVILISYLLQAVDYHKTSSSAKTNENASYEVIRDHRTRTFLAKEIIPGDIVMINDQSPLPCDCVLLKTNEISIFIDTSTIDGETDVKDRFPLNLPTQFTLENLINSNGVITATDPSIDTRDVSGAITFSQTSITGASTTNTKSTKKAGGEEHSDDMNSNKFSVNDQGDIRTSFSTQNFAERGSIICSNGPHYFVVLYTGSHCRSGSVKLDYIARRTLIDVYLEKLSVVIFLFQFSIATFLGYLGYKSIMHDSPPGGVPSYVGTIEVYGSGNFWVFVIILVRNFLLLSFMIPITLKILLPLFRFIYGLFIANDLNFVDVQTGASAMAYSTNITENLGAIDVIVADKTGTLTKNQLELISMTVGDRKFGDNEASTIFEDKTLKKTLENPQEDLDFINMFKALSICHSIRVSANQELFGSSADELAIVRALIKLGWEFYTLSPGHIRVKCPFGTYEYQILRIIPFNRKRMRMSVVVKDENDQIMVYMKGAPERMVRKCTSYSGDMAAMFEQFQKKGFRALSISCRRMDEFGGSTGDSIFEEEHRFLGSIGIEDALQQDVQISVDVLQQAGLKIWVATGDAHVNTIVTAAMLKLLRTTDQLVHLRDNDLRNRLTEFANASMMVPENSFTAMINCESGDLVFEALQNEPFIDGLMRARCVIFYRCKPQTKADVVTSLQQTGRRVLAIGDGANDTQLLRSADVGIGMLGQNGRQGFTTCDFAVPSFRNLCRLILVHGHTSLHRSVLSVHFSFYKALQFALCQAIYQFWTGFSGQSFFGDLSLLTFNQIWTLIPMIAILFEKDVSENFLYRLSFLYKKLRNPLTITFSNLNWMYVAIYQAIATMTVVYLLTGEAFLQTNTGKDLGRDFLSIIVYISQVLIVTFYLVYQLNTLTYYSLVLLIGNILLLIAFSGIFQSNWLLNAFNAGRDWQGFFGECFNSWPAMLLLLTIFLASVSPSWLGLSIWSEIRSTETLLVIEKETIAAKEDQPLFFDPPKQN